MSFNVIHIANDVLHIKTSEETNDLKNVVEYGVRFALGQQSSVGERVKRVNGELTVGVATNLIANFGIDDEIVENTFDHIDIFKTVKKIIGNNVLIGRQLYFAKVETVKEGATTYTYKWMCAHKLPGYIRPLIFYDNEGNKIDFAYLARHEASQDANGVGRSIAGKFPWVSINRDNARKACRKNDGNGNNTDSFYGQRDLIDNEYHIVIPFEVEFATKHSQSQMRGVVDLPYSSDHVALTTETDSNIIVVSNTHGALFVLGQTIAIGTSTSNSSVTTNRRITDIQADTPTVGQTTITFDGDPVTVTAGNIIASRGWITGMTDNVRASSGCYKANDGKHPIMFRGIENPWGNIYEFVDGGKIIDHQLWVTTDRTAYNDTAPVNGEYAAPFSPVSYKNATSNGYIKELGYDEAFPFARLPISVGGDATNATYYADYYYQDVGARTLLVGGRWTAGGAAGLFFWPAAYSLSYSYINIGFRLSFRPLKGVN